MDDITVLILGIPGQAQLDLLKRLDNSVRILMAKGSEEALAKVSEADVILVWAAQREMLEAVLHKASRAKWIHARFAGLARRDETPEVASSGWRGRSIATFLNSEVVLATRCL